MYESGVYIQIADFMSHILLMLALLFQTFLAPKELWGLEMPYSALHERSVEMKPTLVNQALANPKPRNP